MHKYSRAGQAANDYGACVFHAGYLNLQTHTQNIQGDSLARGPKHFGKSIPEFGETHSCVLGFERRPVSASIMSRSCFASFPLCVYKFSSHYLDNIIFIDNSLRPLATESPCITLIAFAQQQWLHENASHLRYT